MVAASSYRAGVSAEGLRFSLLGVPVLVRWTHFLLVAVLLWPLVPLLVSSAEALVRFAPLFVSIPAAVLVHEAGHAAAARGFGGRPRIELVLFGGVTFPSLPSETGPGRLAIVSFAGPAAGLVVGGLVWAATGDGPTIAVLSTASLFVWASVFWGVLNLVPVPGVDGGHILDSVFELAMGPRGARMAAGVKAVVGVAAVVAAWVWLGPFVAVWIVLVLGRQGVDEVRRGWEALRRQSLLGAVEELRVGRSETAGAVAREVMDATIDPELRRVARQVLVAAAAAERDWTTIIEVADESSAWDRPHRLRALTETGRLAEAEVVARSMEGPDGQAALAEVLVRADLGHLIEVPDRDAALAIARRSLMLEAEGQVETGRGLAAVLAGRPEVSALPRAQALLQLEETDGVRHLLEMLSPTDRWLVEVEAAGRADDQQELSRLLTAEPEQPAAAEAQLRLHLARAWGAAAQVGRRALASTDGSAARAVEVVPDGEATPDRGQDRDEIASAIAYKLACSLARGGRPDEAMKVLTSTFGTRWPDRALTDPDLASIRDPAR